MVCRDGNNTAVVNGSGGQWEGPEIIGGVLLEGSSHRGLVINA